MIAYESDAVTVHCADARDVLADMPTESVDLILTDPPYGQEWRSQRRVESFDMLAGDGANDRAGIAETLRECVRVVGQNRHLYVFGPGDVLDGLKVSARVGLVWDKGTPGAGDVTAAWAPAHEPLTFTTSKFRHAGEVGRETVPARLRKGSVLRYTRPTGRKVRHPSEKPVSLLRELIESSTRQGEIVLDPFAGIGSTGVAAILAGRRAVLVDVDPRWVDVAVRRCQAAERLATEAVAV